MICGGSPGPFAGQAAGCRDPARVAAHDFEDEHLGRGLRHRQYVEGRFLGRHRDVFRDRAEARAVVRDGQVIVDGLRDTQALNREAHLARDLRHLVCRIHRVVAAVVKEVADVMCPKHFDQALVLGPVLLDALELVTCRTECAARRVSQRRDRAGAFTIRVDHVLGQRADDAVATRIDVRDLVAMFACRLDNTAGGGIDYGSNAAGLSVESVLSGHVDHSSALISKAHEHSGNESRGHERKQLADYTD